VQKQEATAERLATNLQTLKKNY